jgi:hypothetical protein
VVFPEYGFGCRLPVGWVSYVKPEPRLRNLPVYVLADGTRKTFQLYEQTEASYAIALTLGKLKTALNRPYRRIEQADSTPYWFGCRYTEGTDQRQHFVYIITINKKTYRLEPHPTFLPDKDLPVLTEILRTLRPLQS